MPGLYGIEELLEMGIEARDRFAMAEVVGQGLPGGAFRRVSDMGEVGRFGQGAQPQVKNRKVKLVVLVVPFEAFPIPFHFTDRRVFTFTFRFEGVEGRFRTQEQDHQRHPEEGREKPGEA